MIQLSRRRFIQGAGALFGWGVLRSGGRAFAAPSGLFSQGMPNLSFGILTDIHLSKSGDSFSGQAMFRKALEWFRDQGVDAVAVCGDMADGGLLAELQAVAQTWSAVFPNDTAPDGRHVERLFIYGNHDYGGTSTGSIRGLGLAEAWQQTFGETYTPVWRKEVCGYTFVGAHWTTGGCKGYDDAGLGRGGERHDRACGCVQRGRRVAARELERWQRARGRRVGHVRFSVAGSERGRLVQNAH